MISRNHYRFQRLEPGQLSWGAQIQACLEAFERQQGQRVPANWQGPVSATPGTIAAYDAAGMLKEAHAGGTVSLARPVGYMKVIPATSPGVGILDSMGIIPLVKKELGLVWPAAGELGYLSGVTPGGVSDVAGNVPVVLGIFLDEPQFLYLPTLTQL